MEREKQERIILLFKNKEIKIDVKQLINQGVKPTEFDELLKNVKNSYSKAEWDVKSSLQISNDSSDIASGEKFFVTPNWMSGLTNLFINFR